MTDGIRTAYNNALRKPVCGACGGPLKIVTYGKKKGDRQLQNEAYLTIGGGYGSYVDDINHGGAYTYIICHDCAQMMAHMLNLKFVLAEHATSTVCDDPICKAITSNDNKENE